MAKQKDSEIILTFTENVQQCPPGLSLQKADGRRSNLTLSYPEVSPTMLSARNGGIMKSERSLVPAPFPFISQHVVIEFPELTSDCPESKTLKKNSHKKHIAIPMTRGRDKKTHLA